jgi:hypothetical protein
MSQTEQPVKASLISQDGTDNIDFMFNPTELQFSRSVLISSDSKVRTVSGLPKTNFGSPEPYKLTINGILFDTYEQGTNVMTAYINKFRQSVEFASSLGRPPVYIFAWGNNNQYLKCLVKDLTYTLTMFLPDGTPVRAKVNLTLQEVDTTIASQ